MLSVDQKVTDYGDRSEIDALLKRLTSPTSVQLLSAVTPEGVLLVWYSHCWASLISVLLLTLDSTKILTLFHC